MEIDKKKAPIQQILEEGRAVPWFILAGMTLVFVVLLYPNLVITKQSYQLGDVAERDIKAPTDFFIEDTELTTENRRRAVESVLTVYDHDTVLSSTIRRNVLRTFAEFRKLYESEVEARAQAASENHSARPPSVRLAKEKTAVADVLMQRREMFAEKIGIPVSKGAFTLLIKEGFSPAISNLVIKIIKEIMDNGVVANKEVLLKEVDRGITLRDLRTKTEQQVVGLKQFYGLDQAKTMVRIIGQPLLKELDYNLINLVVDFSQRLVHPNITLNRSETEERKRRAAADVKLALYQIKAGEMLLREGERVTEVQLLKLNTLQAQIKQEHVFTSSLGAALLFICLLVIIYILHIHSQDHRYQIQNKDVLFMAVVVIVFLLVAKITASLPAAFTRHTPYTIPASAFMYGIPLASGAMIICLFMGIELAIPCALVIAVSTAVLFQSRYEFFIYFLLNSIMAAYWIQDCRERKVFVKAGLKLGLLNVVLTAAIEIYLADALGFQFFWNIVFAFLGGMGAGIITAGIAPLLEVAFDYTTDIKLLELANLDRPILRRLMLEAPGTYHHSVIIGSMVEAAAAEIGANPLLAKVCGYYHDIGKINKPLYFIENQTDGKNKHDKLAPSMSSLILIAHIKSGVEIAKEHKLGQIIRDTIRQHHGTSLIRYFYEKAKALKGEDAVNIDDFRYPGPRPQTREAGLVMLADVVEAASRTLENPTPSRIQGLVQNLINKVFSDGQLDHCELTLRDLHEIAKCFNKILCGIHHHRIEYQETRGTANGKGKTKNGSPDRQQAKQAQDTPKEHTEKDQGHLKRLGLS